MSRIKGRYVAQVILTVDAERTEGMVPIEVIKENFAGITEEIKKNTHWIQWIMEGTKDHHPYMDFKQVEDLTPYTEPDTEKIRKEAYTEAKIDAGQEYENGYDAGHNVGYQQGLSDAWEAARKIANMPYDEEEKAFGSGGWTFVEKHTAAEAIEKIRQYEQEKEQESITPEKVMRQYLDTFCMHNKGCAKCPLNTPDFTCGRGHHFLTENPVSDEEVRRAYAIVIAK